MCRVKTEYDEFDELRKWDSEVIEKHLTHRTSPLKTVGIDIEETGNAIQLGVMRELGSICASQLLLQVP